MDDDDRCEQCGSTTFEVDEDGRTYCTNGHEQARGHIIAEDDADFARQGTTVRKKDARPKQKFSRILRGAKAYQLFLQCWQFILWKQCHALVHQKGLPAELWTIVRDLWTLWLSKLDHRLRDPTKADGLAADTEGEGEGEDEPATTSANETDTERENVGDPDSHKKGKRTHESPQLVDTIALNYIGIILLRRPVSLARIFKWIQHEDIPYIRAIRHVPQEMKDRLPSEYHLSLDTTRILEQDDLQIAIYRLAQMYNTTFGMIMPPLNHNLLLLHYVRSLALPIEVYAMARRLNFITKYNFSYPDGTSTSAETTRRQATTFPEAQLISLVVVTTKLLFPFDSDTVKRYPKGPNEATTLRMKWSAWLAAKHSFDKPSSSDDTTDLDGLEPGAEIDVKDSDIFRMSDKQLDQYMDWYQRTWIKSSSDADSQARQSQSQSQSQQESALDREILDMFPLHDVQDPVKTRAHDQQARLDEQSRLDARIREVQASLLPRRAISSEEEVERGLELLRPGAMYPRYRHVEDLDLDNKAAAAAEPAVVRIFHEEVAQTACLSIKALVKAVNKSEQRIEHWLREKRRREVFSEESTDGDMEHDDDNLLATSPPGKLASEMEGLQLGRSSGIHDGSDIDVDMDMDLDMEMLPELEMQAGPSTQ
ncbi:hypothetical protein LTR41_007148 [Exophiala xenobiotica]|nr:hypothetical protein LTR41_007148 [Exophiala xenobiotica]